MNDSLIGYISIIGLIATIIILSILGPKWLKMDKEDRLYDRNHKTLEDIIKGHKIH